MTKRFMIALVAVAVGLLFVALPVSARVQASVQNITTPGATVFIGEQGLNLTPAQLAVDPMGADTQIGWWASAANTQTTAPTKAISIIGQTNSFTVTPANFVGYTGNWYQVNAVTGFAEATPLINVQDPAMDVRIWDLNSSQDVTGGSVIQGDTLAFRVDTNIYQAYNGYRADDTQGTYPWGILADTPAADGYIDINVKTPSGNILTGLWNNSYALGGVVEPITNLNVTYQPWFWGSAPDNRVVPGTQSNWSTGAINQSGWQAYTAGIYTVTATSYLNGMYANYLNGGAAYTGKTVSGAYTVTIGAPMPTVTSISAASGSIAGGTVITISGTGFTGATAVKFGSTAATSIKVTSATTITATAPAHTAGGTVDITVTTPGGTSATSAADQFTYVSLPTVTGISPTAGPLGGGTSVTINGTYFYLVTNVYFGGIPATSYVVNGGTQIIAKSPGDGAGTVDVTVTTPGGTSVTSAADQFTYEAPPTVTKVSPNTGPISGGTSVTITGTGFTGTTNVYFGGTPATSIKVTSATQITATTPAEQSGPVDAVTIITPSGTSAIVPADQFTYIGSTQSSVAVTRSMPATVVPGANINVTLTPGTTFATSPGWGVMETLPACWTFVSTTADSQSVVGGAYQFTELSATPITYTVTAPATPGAYTFNGTYIDGNKDTGTVVGAVLVTVKPNPLQTYDTNSDGIIEKSEAVAAVTDYLFNGTLSKADCVTVVTAYLFNISWWPPSVTGVSPATGSVAGGTSVTITGYAFIGATNVYFGGVPATSYTVNSISSITATAPSGSAGIVDVTVTTASGTSVTSAADQFTYM